MLGQIQQHALNSGLYSLLPLYWIFFPCLPFGGDLLNLAEPNVCCHDLAIFGLAACGASTMRQELFLVVFESCGVLFSFGGRGKL